MGLTIHYELAAANPSAARAHALVAQLRQQALALPFAHVGDIVEFRGDACRPVRGDREHAWLKTQATAYIPVTVPGGSSFAAAVPTHILAFTVHPAPGCEAANFGLCRYPAGIVSEGAKLATGLTGWRWASFCKTQYASNPNCVRVPNFLQAHIGLVRLLDGSKELGLLKDVKDEGGFWDQRDVTALVKEIGAWNAMMAGHVGELKDALEVLGQNPKALQAAITQFPDFEHHEARGRLGKDGNNN
jgi:hypothetical protein